MASIERRGDNWRTVWRYNGAKQYTTWDTHDDAVRAADVARAHRHQVDAEWVYCQVGGIEPLTPEPDRGPTLAEWADKWLASKTRVSPAVLSRYRDQLHNRIIPALGDRRVAEIRPSELGAFLNSLRGDTIKKTTTITRYYSVLSGLFRAAVAEGIRTDNPVALTDFVRDQLDHDDTGEDMQVRLTPAEFDILREAFTPESQPMLDFLVGTGARWSEAAAMPVGNFLPAKGSGERARVRIWRAWKGSGERARVRIWRAWKGSEDGPYLGSTKGRNRREIGITDALAATLTTLADGKDPDELLFLAPQGGPLRYHNWRHRVWDPSVVTAMRCRRHPPASAATVGEFAGVCGDHGGRRSTGQPCGFVVRAGLNRCVWHAGPPKTAVSTCDCRDVLHRQPTPHDLRHTHAAWLFSDPNVTPLAISRRLGHAQLSTTSELYGDLMPEAQEAAVDAIASALGEPKR